MAGSLVPERPCPRCGTPARFRSADGCRLCQHAAHYRRRRAAGKCEACPASLPAPAPVHCPACRDRRNERHRTERRERAEDGVCVDCLNPALPHATRCKRCNARHNRRQTKTREGAGR